MVEFNGRKYYRTTRSKYLYTDHREKGARYKTALHRDIWSHHYGEIPDGYVIHHIDGDHNNNAIENLELLPSTKHQSHHMVSRWRNPDTQESMQIQFQRCQEAARNWHGSPEGIEFHRQLGKQAWVDKMQHTKTCSVCGETYTTPFPTRSMYCSSRCGQRAMSLEGRYKTDKRICASCGSEFMAVPSTKHLCCSKSCAGKFRAANRKKVIHGEERTMADR